MIARPSGGDDVAPDGLGWPRGAVDAHVHVLDPARFPFVPDAVYRPAPAECGDASDLARVLDAHGVDRVVVVSPTAGYDTDNRCMLDALERLGARARGIARVALSLPERDLHALARRGVVGIRIDFVAAGLAPLADPALEKLAKALAARDLVLDIQAEGEQWVSIAPLVEGIPVRVAIDHLGRPAAERGVDSPGFAAMLRLAQTGRVVVKFSGEDRFSRQPPPHADAAPFVDAIRREFGADRLVWGSDWPFLRSVRRTDYGPKLGRLVAAVPEPDARKRILVDTPSRWFGF